MVKDEDGRKCMNCGRIEYLKRKEPPERTFVGYTARYAGKLPDLRNKTLNLYSVPTWGAGVEARYKIFCPFCEEIMIRDDLPKQFGRTYSCTEGHSIEFRFSFTDMIWR